VSEPGHSRHPLEQDGAPPGVSPDQEPPETASRRATDWVADHDTETRDMRPALGTRGQPGSWQRAVDGAEVALARPAFADAQWSFLFKSRDTGYAATQPEPGQVAAVNQRMRSTPVPEVQGPFIKPPVWTWEVPMYFWVGGVASGSSFVALACDAAGDHRSAKVARKLALTAVGPAPLLLIADLGRPERFLNMLRIFKPRSPMNLGAWCLMTFSTTLAGAVGADLFRRPRLARGLGGVTALVGGYLGSYTGVLLASTAVPVWARSRSYLGPIFVATATATGAAASRLTLVACGLPEYHPTRSALRTLETVAILTELSLSSINERRLGPAAAALRQGRPGTLFRVAKGAVVLGLTARLVGRRVAPRGGRGRGASPRVHDLASLLYLTGGLAFRFAWVQAGKASAAHHEDVAAMARGQLALAENQGRPPGACAQSVARPPLRLPEFTRAWGELIRRSSLAVERRLRRG
jgi:formate-dependent nitrite reductase membrane component NrfD